MPLTYKVQVVCYCSALGQIGINTTYWMSRDTSGAGASALQVAIGLDSALNARYKELMGVEAAYRGVSCQILGPTPLVPSNAILNDGFGTSGENLLPGQCSYVLSWHTALAGRHNRGRIYPPFPFVTACDANGKMTAAAAVLLEALASAYTNDYTFGIGGDTSDIHLTVRARTAPPPPAPVDIRYNFVTTHVSNQRFGTQRRRGQYGRLNPLPF